MSKLKQIRCKHCNELFTPKSEKNVFCSRKCFKKDYYYRKQEDDDTGFPMYTCPDCGQTIQMEVHPIRDNFKWLEWHKLPCPGCNTLMIFVSDEVNTKDLPYA